MTDSGLEYVEIFDKWRLDELTKERVFDFFFFGERKILFVVDSKDQFVGVVTLGDFVSAAGYISKAVNEKCFVIRKDSPEYMYSKARSIYERYGIMSDIPVINHENRITGYITDHQSFLDRKASYIKQIDDVKNKIDRFKKSYYLRKEIKAFYEILSNTPIYFRDCAEYHEIFSLFDGNIRGNALSDKEYRRKVNKWVKGGDDFTDEEKTELIFDFSLGNQDILSREFGITPVYGLDKFMFEYTTLTENEEFSRMIMLTENIRYGLKDCIADNGMEDIAFPSNRFLTKRVYDYMRGNKIPFSIGRFNSIAVMRASFQVNGLRGNPQDVIGFSSCDLLEQSFLSNALSERNVHVFNICNASGAKMTDSELDRMKKYGVLDTLIMNKDNDSLKKMYGEDCENKEPDEYAKDLLYYFPVKRRFENDIIVNADYKSPYINIENGIRRTCYQPEEYGNTIYIMGPCIALGPYVEDKHTIASLLSKILIDNKYHYRVVNLGLLSSNNSRILSEQLSLREHDIVINLFYTEIGERIREIVGDIIDPSDAFNKIPDREDMFFDKSVHCNRKGNQVYAEFIYENIKPVLTKNFDRPLKKNHIYDVFRTNYLDLQSYGFREYMELLYAEKSKIPENANNIGSIVMNCNPFTLGHQYLVEYALWHCDYLFIFIVQEDKSYFSFDDRFAMAKANCEKYKNVSVIPSGKMIASDITFPEYFKREAVRDQDIEMSDMTIASALDFRLFACYIAPVLGIQKRFIAEEPLDPVTRQYNENMKEVLGAFGMKVVEIRRRTLDNHEIVSASKVRKMYKAGEFQKMRRMLPESTYRYIMKKQSGAGLYDN